MSDLPDGLERHEFNRAMALDATPHVHEYRCSCGESCPHVAAQEAARAVLGRLKVGVQR